MQSITDIFDRPLRNLRVSVTDRCNLRCQYCMPEEEYVWLPREDLLTFEEIGELVGLFAELGADKVRLTGATRVGRKEQGWSSHVLGLIGGADLSPLSVRSPLAHPPLPTT